jgi:MFS family permease
MRILSNKKLLPLLLTYFIDSLGVGIVLPFLVLVVNRLGGNAVIYGVVGSIYPATQLIGSAVLGSWSDRFGRKAILFVSEIGTMLGWVVFLIALLLPRTEIATISSPLLGTFMLTVPLVFVIMSRAIDGLTGGNYVVAEAYIADVTSETERTASYGLMTVMGNLGFTVGPALAGLLGGTALAEKLPIVVAIVLSAATALIIAVVLPESHKKTVVSEEGSGSGHKVGRRVILENKGIVFVLMLYFAMFIGFNIYYTAFPIHAIRTLGWSVGRLGIYFAALSFTMMFVEGPVLSRVSKRYSACRLIATGSLLLGISFVLLATSRLGPTFAALLFFAFGNGVMWPSMLSLLSRLAGDEIQGLVQGVAGSLGSAASIIGLLVGGILYDQIGTVSFLISATIFGIVVVASVHLAKLEAGAQTTDAAADTPSPSQPSSSRP